MTRSELVGARPVWLLDLEFAGRTWHLSTEPIVVASDAGDLTYDGGLEDPDLEESIDRLETAWSEASASIECRLDADVADLVGRGHPPAGGTAELAMVLVRAGAVLQAWEDRFRLLAGRVVEPRWGDPERDAGWFACLVREEPWEDTTPLIPAAHRITAATVPDAQEEDIGKAYPIVFGRPGRTLDADGTERLIDGSPAYVYQDDGAGSVDDLLIAGHAVRATQVYVRKNGGGFLGTAPVSNTTDSLGHPIALADVSGAAGTRNLDADYWVCWGAEVVYANGGLGAMHDPWAVGELEGVGDVIRWAIAHGRVPVDHGRWAAAAQWLNRFRIGSYLNDPETTAWDLIADEVLPLVPVALRRGPDGVYPIVLDFDARRTEAAAEITEGPDFRQTGEQGEQGDMSDIVTGCRLTYAPDGEGEDYRSVALVAEPDPDDSDQHSDTYAILSEGRYGVSVVEEKSAAVVYDPVTAALIAAWRVRSRAFLPRPVDYVADVSWGWLQVGDLIRMTHAAGGANDRLGMLIAKRWSGTGWELRVLYDDDPPRETRVSS